MKRILTAYAAALLGSAVVLFACQPKQRLIEVERPKNGEVYGVYQGVLPCADCLGIETTLTLFPNDTYQLKYFYRGKEGIFEETGRFTKKGRRLVLKTGTMQYLIVNRDTLEKLDSNGKLISSQQNLQLKRMH